MRKKEVWAKMKRGIMGENSFQTTTAGHTLSKDKTEFYLTPKAYAIIDQDPLFLTSAVVQEGLVSLIVMHNLRMLAKLVH